MCSGAAFAAVRQRRNAHRECRCRHVLASRATCASHGFAARRIRLDDHRLSAGLTDARQFLPIVAVGDGRARLALAVGRRLTLSRNEGHRRLPLGPTYEVGGKLAATTTRVRPPASRFARSMTTSGLGWPQFQNYAYEPCVMRRSLAIVSVVDSSAKRLSTVQLRASRAGGM
jgi:hypothetical protein